MQVKGLSESDFDNQFGGSSKECGHNGVGIVKSSDNSGMNEVSANVLGVDHTVGYVMHVEI